MGVGLRRVRDVEVDDVVDPRDVDAAEAVEATDVDDRRWLGEAHLHHRDQGVAAGDELGIVGGGEELKGLVEARGAVIVELRWVHESLFREVR